MSTHPAKRFQHWGLSHTKLKIRSYKCEGPVVPGPLWINLRMVMSRMPCRTSLGLGPRLTGKGTQEELRNTSFWVFCPFLGTRNSLLCSTCKWQILFTELVATERCSTWSRRQSSWSSDSQILEIRIQSTTWVFQEWKNVLSTLLKPFDSKYCCFAHHWQIIASFYLQIA